jgi:nitrous oxidase accessory protein NosD
LARALDLIAFYGGSRNTIRGNRLTHGNTAGIYLNIAAKPADGFPANPTDYQIVDNRISNMREHGIDVVGAIRPLIGGNHIADVGGAGVALAEARAAVITGNTIGGTAEAAHTPAAQRSTGGIKLMWKTSDCRITANHIAPGGAAYAIFFEDGTAGNVAGGASPPQDHALDYAGDNAMSPGSIGLTNARLGNDANEVWAMGRRIGGN